MMTDEMATALGSFLEVAVKAGFTTAEELAALIAAASNGQDPLSVLASERVEQIFPDGLKLELSMKAELVTQAAKSANAQ